MSSGNDNILIVDDNISIQDDFRKILNSSAQESDPKMNELEQQLFGETSSSESHFFNNKQINYRLSFSSQGNEAIEKIIEAEKKADSFSVVFMDVRMPPGIDGIEAASQIRKIAPHTQIVICSAYSDYSWEDMVKKLGNPEGIIFLKKPFDKIEVQQLALSLSEKWKTARKLEYHINNLEKIVKEKVDELAVAQMQSVESAKFAALGIMSAGLAHELNTPLCAILIASEQVIEKLADDAETPKTKLVSKLLKQIVSMAEKMATIIKAFRGYSRNEKNDSYEFINVKSIIDNALLFCEHKFVENKIELHVENRTQSGELNCHPAQICQVVLNLLNNSFDAIKNQTEKWIKIELDEIDNNIQIVVIDSGQGIPEHVAKNIMVPFYTTKEVGQGTGLGLSISKGIIDQHRGTFQLDTTHPNTRFVVKIPKTQPL
ncbi:MAG: hypothetical protein A2622_13605 [Bdellovibrionales bacterium RIFCSPHIGHO2_01_FULL_40_29]|nr:MAG: hypothetical protein A2622_13605 [Bdellovibrionales bacterium RIFCSPHIGHO2_01_FULL_40_29]OFZ34269.1 MAG: hypothetical protein A3D17_04345 [Bdellovibrionales bacterium RIFCSPHIGHO2_02_FULL_40_15]